MASNFVLDSNAAKTISAHIVLDRKGVMVARVLSTHQSSTLVNVICTEAATIKNLKAQGLPYETYEDLKDHYFQYGRASGYGYDKFTAALSGMWIDGHELTNHCSTSGVQRKPKGKPFYPGNKEYAVKKGYHLANFSSYVELEGKWEKVDSHKMRFDEDYKARVESAHVESGYSDCYRRAGLEYLTAIGYQVITVV